MKTSPISRARASAAPRPRWLLLIAAFAATVLAVSTANAGPRPSAPPRLGIDAARAIALRQVPGQVVEEELDRERGRWVYEFEIRADGGGFVEVEIDADSGAVTSIEADDED